MRKGISNAVLVVTLLLLAVSVIAAPTLTAVPAGAVGTHDVVVLLGSDVARGGDPEWSASGGEWCIDRDCSWVTDVGQNHYGDVVFWRSRTQGAFTITLTDQTDGSTASHSVTVR